MKATPIEIERRLREVDENIELLAVEPAGGDALRIYVDHPDGVNLEICRKVTTGLNELLIDHTLEVSSPGPERPLTKPEHFRRFEGRRAKVETEDAIEDRRKFTGTILEASDEDLKLGYDNAVVDIPYGNIKRSHLAPETSKGAN